MCVCVCVFNNTRRLALYTRAPRGDRLLGGRGAVDRSVEALRLQGPADELLGAARVGKGVRRASRDDLRLNVHRKDGVVATGAHLRKSGPTRWVRSWCLGHSGHG